MRNYILYLTFLLLSIFCHGQTYTQTTATPNVYIVGCVANGGEGKACYWKNDKSIFLPDGDNAQSIAVENGNVYVAGTSLYRRNYAVSDLYLFCYVNGNKQVLTNVGSNKKLYNNKIDMAVCNGKIYITGELYTPGYSNEWVTWIDGEQRSGGGPAITAYEGFIFSTRVLGSKDRGSEQYYFAVNDNVRTDLFADNNLRRFYGITVLDGNVYVAGEVLVSDKWRACYWINGKGRLSIPGYLNDIAVLSDGSVHTIGMCSIDKNEKIPFYWYGNNVSIFAEASRLIKICAFENKIYILGYCKKGVMNIPCYWIMAQNQETGKWETERMVTIPGAKDVYDMVVTKD